MEVDVDTVGGCPNVEPRKWVGSSFWVRDLGWEVGRTGVVDMTFEVLL